MANVKVFADKQTDTQTNERAKNYYAPNLLMRGHKKGKSCHILYNTIMNVNDFDEESFRKHVGKGENGDNQHILFQQCLFQRCL